MNPEEGDLRPQLLDRFAHAVDIFGISDSWIVLKSLNEPSAMKEIRMLSAANGKQKRIFSQKKLSLREKIYPMSPIRTMI
jgi:hypothetical protein